jgi:hypothetical protein
MTIKQNDKGQEVVVPGQINKGRMRVVNGRTTISTSAQEPRPEPPKPIPSQDKK